MADMFDVLRASLFTDEDVPLSDWQLVYEEMKQQTVASLAGEWLQTHLNAPAWQKHCFLRQAEWARVMHAQDQLLQLLEANHIPCVILKGAAAAMAYPHPTLRSMGDVDFLVRRADFEKAAALLEANGYALTEGKDLKISHHYRYEKNRIRFELHRGIPIVAESDEKWMAFFEAGIDAREWHETEGHRFPVFPATLNGLVLIFHINQHLRSGLGLRQIIDWMMYVHTLPADQWEKLQPLLEETGHTRLARTVTLLCQRYLGLRKIVDEDASLPVDALLAYILDHGNFGRKIGFDGKISFLGKTVKTPADFFRLLQTGGRRHWSAAERHTALKPFAWVYQAFRVSGMLIARKKTPGAFLKLRRHGVEQRALIDALGLQTDRTIHQH